MDALRQDLRFALRALKNRPALVFVASVTLALGIGGATALFTVVDGVVFKPLAHEDSEQLITVWQTFPSWRDQEILREVWREIPFSFPEYADWRQQQTSFEDVAIFSGFVGTLLGSGEPERINVGQSTPNLFSLLRTRPVAGRLFTADDERPDAARTALITYPLWQSRFGGDTNIVGKALLLDAAAIPASYTIIGVLPPDFHLSLHSSTIRGQEPVFWTLIPASAARQERNNHSWEAIGRLRRNVPFEAAVRETELIISRSDHRPEHGAYLLTRHEQETGKVTRSLLILFAAAGLVLIIACGNVANLMLSESAMRHQEFAVRAALGAGRLRIIRQLLAESMALSLFAALLGLAAAFGVTRALLAIAPAGIPRLQEIAVDGRVLAFATAVAAGAAIVFALVPAIMVTRTNLNDALNKSGRTRGSGRNGIQGAIVTAEISMSFVLLVAAALLTESLMRLSAVNPGLSSENVLTIQLSLPASRYPDEPQFATFFNEAIGRLESLPGVQSVSGISILPFGGGASSNSIEIEGLAAQGQRPEAQRRFVFPKYFETVRTPVLTGRTFTPSDTSTSDVMIVNQTMAQRFWPNQNAIGKRVRFNRRWASIVGVVQDVKDRGLGLDTQTTFYIPMSGNRTATTLVMRTATDPLQSASAVRSVIHEMDKDLAIGRIATMDSLISQSMSQEHYRTLLIAVYAACAGLLAAIGLYGMMERAVVTRMFEIGIRMTLGAAPTDIMRLV
ncbi:MAG: ABC transporter permease, partial [Acidobacteria bacterium]|nr:ABC transporter permease [Acidobacteriota bacterium]